MRTLGGNTLTVSQVSEDPPRTRLLRSKHGSAVPFVSLPHSQRALAIPGEDDGEPLQLADVATDSVVKDTPQEATRAPPGSHRLSQTQTQTQTQTRSASAEIAPF